ncbi:hypothetical protein ACFL6S_02330 [Candidatus Poribacteria bacterium]
MPAAGKTTEGVEGYEEPLARLQRIMRREPGQMAWIRVSEVSSHVGMHESV